MNCLGKVLAGLSVMVVLAVAEEAPPAFWSASPTRAQITKSRYRAVFDTSQTKGFQTTQVKERGKCPIHYGVATKDLCLHWLEEAGVSTQNDEWNIADSHEISCLLLVTQNCCAKREIIPVISQTVNPMVRIVIKYDESTPLADGRACPLESAVDNAKKYYKYTYYRSAQELMGYFYSGDPFWLPVSS